MSQTKYDINMIYPLLWATLVASTDSTNSLNVLNQCPQPTDSNPDPAGFVFAHPDDCRYYFTCSDGKPQLRQCKPHDRAVYSDFYHTCVGLNTGYNTCTRLNAQRECRRGMAGLIGHPTLCHRYYNCSQSPRKIRVSLEDYEDECPYPQLFDIETRMCTFAKDASCGPHRLPAKDQCDYVKSVSSSCARKLPLCIGLEDGFHPLPGSEWTKFYIACHKGRLREKLSCDKHVPTRTEAIFSPDKKTCVSRFEVPRSTGIGLAPSCDGKSFGVYRTAERRDVYYSCPAGLVLYCEPGTVFNEASYMCQSPGTN